MFEDDIKQYKESLLEEIYDQPDVSTQPESEEEVI